MSGSIMRAGTITLKVDGGVFDAKGSFTYNLGNKRRQMIAGSDKVHGAFSTVQVPFIEGVITDGDQVDLAAIQNAVDVTVTLDLDNGKTILLSRAVYAGEGNVTTEQGEIAVRWEGMSAREIN